MLCARQEALAEKCKGSKKKCLVADSEDGSSDREKDGALERSKPTGDASSKKSKATDDKSRGESSKRDQNEPTKDTAEAEGAEANKGGPVRAKTTEELTVQLPSGEKFYRPETRAHKRTGRITIDGKGNEKAWQGVPETISDFQLQPVVGKEAYGISYFRVLYDSDALYVLVRMIDPEPSRILKPVLRRDLSQANRSMLVYDFSDWVTILIDPDLDRRSAYGFETNPRGVQNDWLLFNDSNWDLSFDAIWESAAELTDEGWTAEFRIPLSQLRLRGGMQDRWGLQVRRRIGFTREVDQWAPSINSSGRYASVFGDLIIEDKLAAKRSLEIRPYVLLGANFAKQEQYILRNRTDPSYNAGLNLKFNLFETLTVTADVLPDNGEVEQDPSAVNLSDLQLFFPERRLFFIKDQDLFNYPLDGFQRLFYSRRVGAKPHIFVGNQGVAQLVPRESTILGASKVTGSLPGGFEVGLLTAVSDEEEAEILRDPATSEIDQVVVEPMTSHNVLSLRRSFRGGLSDLRLLGTFLARRLKDTGIDTLHRTATTGGARYMHRADSGGWSVEGSFAGSQVTGSRAAILATQTANPRYFQRPDAEHLRVDDTLRSLSGTFTRLEWETHDELSGKLGIQAISPGFEANDLGFLNRTDIVNTWVGLNYNRNSGNDRIQQAFYNLEGVVDHDFDGELLQGTLSASGQVITLSNANLSSSLGMVLQRMDPRLLRGGPSMGGVNKATGSLSFTSAPRKTVFLLDANAWLDGATSYAANLSSGITFARETSFVSIAPAVDKTSQFQQFLGSVMFDGQQRFLMGHLNQTTVSAQLRWSWSPTATLAIDAFFQPFVSSGVFNQYRAVSPGNERAEKYSERYDRIDAMKTDAGVELDIDRSGSTDATIGPTDFTQTDFLANVVLRWDYRPGSTLFAVWSHTNGVADPTFNGVGEGLSRIADGTFNDTVMLKLSYWWNP